MKKTFVISLLLLVTAALAWAGPAVDVRIDGVDVARVRLPEPVDVAGPDGKMTTRTEGYLIRVLGQFPVGTAIPVKLSFGDKSIAEYGSFGGGLYFVVYEQTELDALAGKAIHAVAPNGKTVDSTVTLDPKSFDLKTLREFKDLMGLGVDKARVFQ